MHQPPGEPLHQHPVPAPLEHLQVEPHRLPAPAQRPGWLPAVDGLRSLRLPAQGRCADHAGADRPDQEAGRPVLRSPPTGPHSSGWANISHLKFEPN